MPLYYNFLDSFFKGEHDLVDDNLKIILLDADYSPDQTNHTTYSDVSANEVSGTGYSAGGALLDNNAWARSGSQFNLTARDVGWYNPTISPRYAVLYNDTHSSDELIAYFDLGSTLAPNGTTLVLEWGDYIISVDYSGCIFANLIYHCGLGQADLSSDTIKCVLLKQTYSPDTTNQETYSDISSEEVTGTGYTAGGATVVSPSLSLSGATLTFDISTGVAWEDLDLDMNCRYAVLYDDTNTEDALIYYEDLGANIDPGGDSFFIPIASGGVFTYVG